MLKAPSGTNWTFEEFQVMTEMRLLMAAGKPVPLTSKAFDTLVVLIENSDRVVTKDELLRSVWPDVEVEEGNLTQQIFLLRKALGESAQEPRHIVTIPGHGYRFTARVSATPNDSAATTVSSSSGPASPPVSPRRGVTFIATALVAVGVITLGLRWMPSEQAGAPADFTKHISRISESGKVTFSAISRDGQYVAYVENEGDEHSLWVKRVGTEGKTPVVPSQPLRIAFPSFNPDGEYVYFVRQSARGPIGVLYRVPILGGLETPILEDVDSPVSFSPDGREFVFVRGSNAATTIIVAAVGGGAPQRILATFEAPLRSALYPPDWSPDGKVVAVAVTDSRNQSRSIVLLPLAGGSSRELYRTDLGVGRVRWLPDGSALLAVMSSGLERRVFGRASGGAIWRIDYASGQAEQLTSGLANNDPYSLDIAADGAVADVINTFVSDLWIAPADRLDSLRPLTSDHPVIGRHTWLPDNDTMVYRDMSGRLNAVHKDGRAFSLPVPDGEFTTGVSVCGDGSYVVFSTRSNLWRVTPNAGAPIKLTSGFRDFNAACSADGKSVWYLSREPNTPHPSLWRVSIDGGRPEPMNLAGYDVLPSPTGRMILYQTDWVEEGANRNRRDRWEIISSSDRKRLYTFDVAGDTDIGMMTKWAPDESGVDYVVTKDGVSNIWRQLLTGGPPVQVTQFSVQRIFSFAWSPDGRWLSLGMGVFRSDVVLMSSQQ